MHSVSELFKRLPIGAIVDDQLYEAQRRLLEHEAAAEHHGALADMYRRRVQRLWQAAARSEALEAEETAAIDLKTGRRLRA